VRRNVCARCVPVSRPELCAVRRNVCARCVPVSRPELCAVRRNVCARCVPVSRPEHPGDPRSPRHRSRCRPWRPAVMLSARSGDLRTAEAGTSALCAGTSALAVFRSPDRNSALCAGTSALAVFRSPDRNTPATQGLHDIAAAVGLGDLRSCSVRGQETCAQRRLERLRCAQECLRSLCSGLPTGTPPPTAGLHSLPLQRRQRNLRNRLLIAKPVRCGREPPTRRFPHQSFAAGVVVQVVELPPPERL